MNHPIKLTQYSHGSGCGCKISPAKLKSILAVSDIQVKDENLIIGHDNADDAAVYKINSNQCIISTTDFFMPIVDDPIDFGRIAATNALSDIYAMGGNPIMAISILGWPVDVLDEPTAGKVIEGGRIACRNAKINISGGHSIDNPEPIFGLAVTGICDIKELKSNEMARPGAVIYLTKPLGIGIYSTAEKRNLLDRKDRNETIEWMTKLNDIGNIMTSFKGLQTMTDVTGFGLLGHLNEVCEASQVSAEIFFNKIPLLDKVMEYLALGVFPGGTTRNWNSYGQNIDLTKELYIKILCDPQTSGGLLMFVDEDKTNTFEELMSREGYDVSPIGRLISKSEKNIIVNG